MIRLSKTAEKLGFHSIWVTDRTLHNRVPVLEPLTVIAHVIANTTRVRLGTSVLVSPLRNPVILARRFRPSTTSHRAG